MDNLKRIGKIILKRLMNREKKILGLKFNPGFVLTILKLGPDVLNLQVLQPSTDLLYFRKATALNKTQRTAVTM